MFCKTEFYEEEDQLPEAPIGRGEAGRSKATSVFTAHRTCPGDQYEEVT